MIRYIKGNLLESEAQALVNTVNTQGVMGKGLALQFRERFPENYRIYRDVCKRGELKIGQMLVTEAPDLSGERYIINFPTKTSWRKPSSYSYIEEGLKDLKRVILENHLSSVAIPPLGSRNGGLDWNRVKVLIENALCDLECDLIIYEPSDIIIDKMKSERVKLTPARAMMLDVVCDLVKQGEFLSEFSAEKIVYFLQRFGAEADFKLSFQHGYYGPYSGKVRYVLRYLNGSYLMGLAEMNQKPFEPIWISPDTMDDVKTYLNTLDSKYVDILSKTKAFLDGFYSNYSLELLATVDYILLHDERGRGWVDQDLQSVTEFVIEDIAQWSERKERMFGEESNVQLVLSHLKDWQSKMMN